MAVLIDDSFATSFLTYPIREGWVEEVGDARVVAGITPGDITVGDVALVPTAVATRLAQTHVIDRSVAVVHEGIGMTSLWTPERADEIEEAAIWLAGVGLAGETLARALLKPYFGIQATSFTQGGEAPDDAQVIIRDGVSGLMPPENGFTEDLARAWFIMTGWSFVSHITVVGVRALARDADEQVGVLRTLVETGHERRRDVRRMIHEASGVDRDALSDVTGLHQ